jgi:diadenylate cyclase
MIETVLDAVRNLLYSIYGLFTTLGQTVSIWNVVDILIVAYIIYRVLSLMRKTSAGSVIRGILLILVIAALANILNLTVITYLLDQMMVMGVIVLVVLFQPELRKLFEQVGSSRLSVIFKKRSKDEHVEHSINCVVTAANVLAKLNTGAIIVFEREVGLNEYAATGVRIDAVSSAELIQNIFFINSPLHDGAVILRDGRLLSAACMLPLSSNITLSRELGMRHRAAVGISERSDAVVVIVSEESGAVSVAADGMLKRRLTRDALEALLRNELLRKMTDENKKKNTRKKRIGERNEKK